jgi:hypothetical protein
MSLQGVVSSKKTNDTPGLCPIKGLTAMFMTMVLAVYLSYILTAFSCSVSIYNKILTWRTTEADIFMQCYKDKLFYVRRHFSMVPKSCPEKQMELVC